MEIIIGVVVIGILVFVVLVIVLSIKNNKLSKEVELADKFIHSYDESSSDVDNSVVKINAPTIDNNGRKTVVLYPFKDCKEGITISWKNKEN